MNYSLKAVRVLPLDFCCVFFFNVLFSMLVSPGSGCSSTLHSVNYVYSFWFFSALLCQPFFRLFVAPMGFCHVQVSLLNVKFLSPSLVPSIMGPSSAVHDTIIWPPWTQSESFWYRCSVFCHCSPRQMGNLAAVESCRSTST